VPTEKLAYVEVGEEHPDKRVGFSSLWPWPAGLRSRWPRTAASRG
jgi:hypothetical protein